MRWLWLALCTALTCQQVCEAQRSSTDGLRQFRFSLPERSAGVNGWWRSAVFYQIYPRSFKDSDGDGIGDLRGIIEKLPYLKEIGVDGFWMSPIFKSPMADFGYDISDYYAIQPEYGTMADFDALIVEAKQLGLKVLLDFVPNHSSDENEWFVRSEARAEGYDDYYVWHSGRPNPDDPAHPLPPNNWVSMFRGSAWQWSERRRQFYLHQFSVKQPDLNYRNPKVVDQMKDVMRFWLQKGVDGYRVDAVPTLFEVEADANGNFPDEPLSGNTDDPNDPGYTVHIYTQDRNETLDMVYQWRAVMDDFQRINGGDERIIMAETYSPIDVVMKYYGNGTVMGAQIPFNFHFITDLGMGSSASDFQNTIHYWLDRMPKRDAVPNWVMGNHDQHRVATRFGVEKVDMLNMILLSLPGASVSYNGEEIGMTDVWISYNDTVDPAGCNAGPSRYQFTSRDPERTPFQWNANPNGGFSTGNHTWLPLSPDYRAVNVAVQKAAQRSVLKVYEQLTALKHQWLWQSGLLRTGVLGNVLIILRNLEADDTLVTLANFGTEGITVDLSQHPISLRGYASYEVVSNRSNKDIGYIVDVAEIELEPYESAVLRISPSITTYQTFLQL